MAQFQLDTQTIFRTDRHIHNSTAMQKHNYDLGDITDEHMQFVNPHEIHPLISPTSIHVDSGVSQQQVSSKSIHTPSVQQNVDIQMQMEEFSDLSALMRADSTTAILADDIDELNTPIFDADAFDFIQQPDKTIHDKGNVKVKVEYNAQVYQWPGAQVPTPYNNPSVNASSKQEMFLYQPLKAHQMPSGDDFTSLIDADFDHYEAECQTPFDILSVNNNNNVTYNSSSNVSSPQDNYSSYISSPINDETLHSPMEGGYTTDVKPRLNLMLDHFRFPIKEEETSILNTPDVIDQVVNLDGDFNILELVDPQEIGPDFVSCLNNTNELSSPPSTPSTPSTYDHKSSSPAKTARKRKPSFDDEDDDEDYIPPSKRKSTVSLKDIDASDHYSSDDSDYEVRKTAKRPKSGSKPRGRPPKRVSSVSSDGSKFQEMSKYRELRDKNNEASRKSRLKRKIKEQEYEKEVDELNVRNIKLRTEAEQLEKMINEYRSKLVEVMVKK